MSQGSFAQAGWAIEQYVVQRFTPAFSGGNGYAQIILDLGLPDEVIEAPGSQVCVKRYVLGIRFT